MLVNQWNCDYILIQFLNIDCTVASKIQTPIKIYYLFGSIFLAFNFFTTFESCTCLVVLAQECGCLHSCVPCLIHNSSKVSTSTLNENVNQTLRKSPHCLLVTLVRVCISKPSSRGGSGTLGPFLNCREL